MAVNEALKSGAEERTHCGMGMGVGAMPPS